MGGPSAACAAVANPAAAPSDKTAAVMKNFVIVLPFLIRSYRILE